MSVFFTNASDWARGLLNAYDLVYKDIGVALTEKLWVEFERLVKETPQYTGTAAASWNIGMPGMAGAGGGVRVQRKRTRETALRMGHMAAVGEALGSNFGFLNIVAEKWSTADILIWNDAESSLYAEYGPLRPINDPGLLAFSKFVGRLTTLGENIVLPTRRA